MPADLITRLLLKNDDFDRNLQKSATQVQTFDKGIGILKSGVAKFAAGLGAAITVGEVFNKAMRSNQTTSDMFDNTLNAAKDTVDVFFRSLVTGDWTVFNNGILTTFSNLKDLSAKMDELADKKLSLTYIRASDLKDIERFEQLAKDTNQSKGIRVDAAQNMQGVINHLNKKTQETIDFEMQTLNDRYASKSGLKINKSDLQYFVSNTNYDGGLTSQANEAYKRYVELQNEADKLQKSAIYDIKTYGRDMSRTAQKEYEEKRQNLELFKQGNEFLIKQGWLTEENDAERQKTVETLIKQLDTEREIYSLQKRADETARGVKTSTTEKKKPLKGSLDYVNAQITDLTGKLNAATDEATRTGFKNALKKLKEEKLKIELEIGNKPEKGSLDYINAEISELSKKLNAATDEATRYGIRAAIEKLNKEKHLIELEATIKPLQPEKFSKVTGKNPSEALNDKIKPAIDKSAIKDNYSYADSLQAIGSVMGSLTSVTGEGAAAWFSYGANVLSTVATAIPAIMALTTAHEAETNANMKAAVSGAMASTASIPVVGWIMAASAAASIIAIMASMPKFAGGGISGKVPGSLVSGDRVPIWVNSGEMILNQGQQGNLFRMLNTGENNRNNVQVTGEVRISGDQMRVLLRNADRKFRRGI